MTQRVLPFAIVAGLAAVLWVVPSIVSQGMVAVGERFSHADRALAEPGQGPDEARIQLRHADARVEAALAARR